MSYSIEIRAKVKKYLLAMDGNLRSRISRRIDNLTDNPRPADCKKLKTREAYRIRIGDYRVIYEIHDDVLVVLVIRLALRRDVYS